MTKQNVTQQIEQDTVDCDLLFYDGRCPLCAKEMRLISKLKRPSLELVDIHSLATGNKTGDLPEKEALLKILHLKTANNEWVTGVDASVHAWSHTAYGWLFKPLRWPLIKPIADRVYTRWAESRYCKLDY